jgi:hypothetical protein
MREAGGHQQGLFDGTPAPTPRQRVNRERDAAMQRVAERAEQARAAFLASARAFVRRYLAEHGPTSGEVLSLKCKASGITPHDDRAFGPVYFGLSREGVIEKVGTVRRERGHGTAGGNVWALR